MTLGALLASVVLGGASLAWGFWGMGLPGLARWSAAFAMVWLFAVWQRWRWFSYVGLAAYFAAAALGLWFLNFPPGWMFAGAIFGLLAWDLTSFRYRQTFAASDAERRSVEARHMLGISVLAVLGFALASLAMLLEIRFTFDWAVFLVIVLSLS
ncbi:MAG TPA: hypothetical protein VFH29_07275, partial [Anaerolineales bacterium]|nr:hypothetical protein [Anaerolineales bacterium]